MVVKVDASKAIEFIEDVTRNCDAVQERVLAEILSHNADTEYLKRHRLDGKTDRESFKSRIPVVTYEDILPEIRRIADGDFSPILSADPVVELITRNVRWRKEADTAGEGGHREKRANYEPCYASN